MPPEVINVSYWGSPGISAAFLQKLLRDPRFNIKFVVTQPDKARSSRGRGIQPTEVKKVAEENSIPVYSPSSLKKNSEELKGLWAEYSPSFHVVFAYGRIIPEVLFNFPPLGSVNFHASLLPLLRGASPIEHAIWEGCTKTGWTLQKMAQELDSGDILSQYVMDIAPTDTTSTLAVSLLTKLKEWGPQVLYDYAKGRLNALPQDISSASHCGKIHPSMGAINWKDGAGSIRNQARALQERPGVYAYLNETRIKFYFNFHLPLKPSSSAPGVIDELTAEIIYVSAGDGQSLPVESVQPEGKKRLKVREFANGYRINKGDTFISKIAPV